MSNSTKDGSFTTSGPPAAYQEDEHQSCKDLSPKHKGLIPGGCPRADPAPQPRSHQRLNPKHGSAQAVYNSSL